MKLFLSIFALFFAFSATYATVQPCDYNPCDKGTCSNVGSTFQCDCNGQKFNNFICSQTNINFFQSEQSVSITSKFQVYSSAITVSGLPSRLPLNSQLNIQTFITFDSPDEAFVYLRSPEGTVIEITTGNGNSAPATFQPFDGVFWADRDATSAQQFFSMVNRMTEFFPVLQPEEPLTSFVGENPNGEWVLMVEGKPRTTPSSLQIEGMINGWSIFIELPPEEKFITPCDSNPCQNGGVCTNVGHSSFTCDCSSTPFGYSSTPTCGLDIDLSFSSGEVVRPKTNDRKSPVETTVSVSGLPSVLTPGTTISLQTKISVEIARDLHMYLVSPQGTVLTIVAGEAGYSGLMGLEPFDGTIWVDDGPTVESQFADNGEMQFLAAAPEDSFSTLLGENPNGVWTLRVYDVDDSIVAINHDFVALLRGWTVNFGYSTDVYNIHAVTQTGEFDGTLGEITMVINGEFGSSDPIFLGSFPNPGDSISFGPFIPAQSFGKLKSLSFLNSDPSDFWGIKEVTVTTNSQGAVPFGMTRIKGEEKKVYAPIVITAKTKEGQHLMTRAPVYFALTSSSGRDYIGMLGERFLSGEVTTKEFPFVNNLDDIASLTLNLYSTDSWAFEYVDVTHDGFTYRFQSDLVLHVDNTPLTLSPV